MERAPNILPFPPKNKGRIRKSRSIEAGGELMLSHMAWLGDPVPDNIARIRPMPQASPVARSPAMLLAISIWATVPADRKNDVRRQLRYLASVDHCPHALALSQLLS